MKKQILSGIDRLSTVSSLLKNKKIGLMTNPTGINRYCQSTIDIIAQEYTISAMFSPEHGVRGDAQAGVKIDTYTDGATGATVYSLYGKNKKLTEEMINSFDVFVFDIQDVGARFYTYLYSLSYIMEDCAKANKPLIVLDRINPINGVNTSGTILNTKFSSFVGEYPIPTQYGLTIGEYALFINNHLKLDLDLTIVPLKGWERKMYLDDTNLPWVAPSPNCQTLNTALCYIGTCVFEGTNLSEGRGTTQPFEIIGAPWIKEKELEDYMNSLGLPGVIYRKTYFTPMFSKHQGALCKGIQVHIINREEANLFHTGLMLLEGIEKIHSESFEYLHIPKDDTYFIDKLLGTDEYRTKALSAQGLMDKYQPLVKEFARKKEKHHLYA